MRRRHRGVDEVVGLAPGMAVRGAVLLAPGDEPRAAARIAHAWHAAGAPHRLTFPQTDVDDPFPALVRDAWPTPVRPAVRWGAPRAVPVMDMRGRGYDEWLVSKSSNFRQRVRREGRRMEAKGATFRLAETPDDLDWALGEFHRLHAAKWGARSPLSSAEGLEMMRRAAAAMGPGRMRVHVIQVDDRAVSVQVFVAHGGELIYWNGGWDPEWAAHSPALVGIVAALEDGFARGDRRLDLGEDDTYDYKKRIADGDAPVATVVLTPRGVKYPAALAVTAPERVAPLVRKAARAAVRHPRGPWELARRLRRRGAS